jgi:hypothetical protein
VVRAVRDLAAAGSDRRPLRVTRLLDDRASPRQDAHMGEAFRCEKCHEVVDPNSSDVIRLTRWDEVEAAFNAPATRLEGP